MKDKCWLSNDRKHRHQQVSSHCLITVCCSFGIWTSVCFDRATFKFLPHSFTLSKYVKAVEKWNIQGHTLNSQKSVQLRTNHYYNRKPSRRNILDTFSWHKPFFNCYLTFEMLLWFRLELIAPGGGAANTSNNGNNTIMTILIKDNRAAWVIALTNQNVHV